MAVENRSLRDAATYLLGARLKSYQLDRFDWYARELISWNRRFNLTAISDVEDIEAKHFLDSLTCLLAMGSNPAGRAVDIGSGAGFPGLPLKIVCPQLQMTLIESTGKKVRFCRHVIEQLGLEGVGVIHDRAERVGRLPEHREAYDWVLARAVAALPTLAEYMLPLMKMGGKAIAQKGETGPAEAQAAEPALKILGGHIEQLIPVELPRVAETRYLVLVNKIAATPSEYPRRPGIPTKRPLGGGQSKSHEIGQPEGGHRSRHSRLH